MEEPEIIRGIPNSFPHLDSLDEEAVQTVFRSGQIAAGREVEWFERELADFLGVPDVVAVSSGFAALHLALLAVGVQPGDEVVIPCVSTCAAIRNSVLAAGAIPVFADTERRNLNLSVASVEQKLSARTRAIVSPHHTGIPADIGPLNNLGVPVIEDCAQALGAVYRGHKVGSCGAAAMFSFYPTKVLTTIDGGAVASRSPEVTARVRDLRSYSGRWDSAPRFNYKMQNLHAALGRCQLRKLPRLLERRCQIGRRYRQTLLGVGLSEESLLHRDGEGIYFRFGLRVPPELRDKLLSDLTERGIPCGIEVGFLCPDQEKFMTARQIVGELITFPTYPALSDDDVEMLMAQLLAAFSELHLPVPFE
jgi:dTDP-4-amino-4,6-dideoxygalactose transaminase